MHANNDSLLAGLPGALMCLLCASSGTAQDPVNTDRAPAEVLQAITEQGTAKSKPVRESVPGELFLEPDIYTLETLRKRVAHATETDILTHARDKEIWEQATSVTFDRPVRMNAKDAMTFFSRVLDSQSFLLTKLEPKGSVLEIIAMHGASRMLAASRVELKTPTDVFAEPDLVMMVSVQRPLKHLAAMQTTNSLRPFLASSGGGNRQTIQIGTLGNSLIIRGMQHDVARLLRQLDMADVETEEQRNFDARLRELESRIKPVRAQGTPKRKS